MHTHGLASTLPGFPRLLAVFACAWCWVLACPSSGQAQAAPATVTVSVTDPTGAAVPDVVLVLVNTATRLERKATVNATGVAVFEATLPGRYTITAERTGFAPGLIGDIVVREGDQLALVMNLRLATVSELVNVTAPGAYVAPVASTATKTDTPIMETPLSIQVVPLQVLEDQQVIQLDQALRNISGVTTSKDIFGTNILSFRGFSSPTLFRNGIRFDSNFYGDAQQFSNVESVEVLKGPAAILFGRVEPGGIVNVITKQPLAKPYYAVNQQVGSYGLYRTTLDATGPLTTNDTLLYRVNASFQGNDSFRELISSKNVFVAPVLTWNISPRTQATVEMEYQHQDAQMDFQFLPFDQTSNRVIDDIPHSRYLGLPNPEKTKNILVGGNWSHQFNPEWSLRHSLTFKRNDVTEGYGLLPFDVDLDSRTVVNGAAFRGRFVEDTTATVLDLNGRFKALRLEHNLLIGGDYYRLRVSDGASSAFIDPLIISLDHPTPPVGPPLDVNPSPSASITKNYGVYFQDQVKLPSHFFFTGGLRYQYVRAGNDEGFGPGGSVSSATVDHAVTPRLGLLWQPQPRVSLYGNYAQNFGAQPGAKSFEGVDASGNALPGRQLPPETAQQWEGGAKVVFFEGRLRGTLAYFNLTKQNVATADTDPTHICGAGGPRSCSLAIGEVRSRGPELDVQGAIFNGWSVVATYANQDVRVTRSNNEDVGNRLAFVPRSTGSVWTTYEVQEGLMRSLKFGGGVNGQTDVVDSTNTVTSPGYRLVGLMAGYSLRIGRGRLTAQVNVENLLNKNYWTNAAPFSVNSATVNFGTPRSVVASVKIDR